MEEIHMNNVKKIVILLLALGAMTGFTRAATHQSGPNANLRLSMGSFALGIGTSWGSGTLYYKGKDYQVKIKRMLIGREGATSSSACVEVILLQLHRDVRGL